MGYPMGYPRFCTDPMLQPLHSGENINVRIRSKFRIRARHSFGIEGQDIEIFKPCLCFLGLVLLLA